MAQPRRSRWLNTVALVAMAVFLGACAPSPTAPRIDDTDYVFPEIRRGELTAREEKDLKRAWDDVLVGRPDRAEQTIDRVLHGRRDLRPAFVILGFSALRAGRPADAQRIFGSVLAIEPNDAAALLGQASIHRKAGDLEQALPLYLRAQRLRPRDESLGRRVSEIRLSVAESAIARAGSLSAEGRKGDAVAMLQKALDVAPELAPVRLELADLLVETGRRAGAIAILNGAPTADRSISLKIATLRFEDGDLEGAEVALRRGVANVADDAEAASLLSRIRDRRSLLALPEPLRAIGDSSRITRADLAALVVIRIESLKSRPATGVRVASDLSRTWARPQILRALELGLMDVYPNHTFQPAGIVRRGELAQVAARVLDLGGWGRSTATPPKDMSPSHLQYGAAVRVIGAGVMQSTPSGVFEPWRIVTGAEAKAVVDALARLALR